jgi:hypothetical protein
MVLQQQKIVNKKKSPLHPIFRIIFDHWKFFMLEISQEYGQNL